jgi:hypothetical protein
MTAALIMAILLPVLMAAAFLFGRHLQRRLQAATDLSPVTRQHIDLFQGGELNEALVESAKRHFRELLEQGQVAAVEASLRPGMQYVFQVRALAEIGTEEAGRILERQLQRHLSDDQLEQSWYWIDLASSLRLLHREESLPQLLRCAEMAGEIPLGHFFAAETVCFLSFAGYLRHPETAQGQAALRLLLQAMQGLRFGVPAQMIAEARLGEMLEKLWDGRPHDEDPLIARIARETLRLLRREGTLAAALVEDRMDRETFAWQMSHLAALESTLHEYLQEIPRPFARRLKKASDRELADLLHALHDLRADAGPEVMELLSWPKCAHAELAVELLTWSRDARVGPWLREYASRHVPMVRRAQRRPRTDSPSRSSLPDDFPYQAVLRALRNHPSPETESFLLLAAEDWDPRYRAAAAGSLGWWEPFQRDEVLDGLNQCRRDVNPEVRQAARAALARLGERQALQWFRQALAVENARHLHEALQVIASENLTLLWPDIDRLADSEDPEIAFHARESMERLSEEMEARSR